MGCRYIFKYKNAKTIVRRFNVKILWYLNTKVLTTVKKIDILSLEG